MSIRVYRFGADVPLDRSLVLRQLRAAHDYANELTSFERGRRDAIRALLKTPEVLDAEAGMKAATKSDRKKAKDALICARRKAIQEHSDQIAEINRLHHELHLGARALTPCYWGTYLGVEAAADQARQAPYYGEDMLTPSNPKFRRWNDWPLNEGQIGVQVQKNLTTARVLAGESSYVKVRNENIHRPNRDRKWKTLLLCVERDGRTPIYAQIRVCWHRKIPDNAIWKWVRLSVRREGLREKWSVEITVDDPAEPARSLDTQLKGAIAVAFSWLPLLDGSIEVATWEDTDGKKGDIILPARLVTGMKKPNDLRAVRDILWNEAMPKIRRALEESGKLPKWLADARDTIKFWRSLTRVRQFHRQWKNSPLAVSEPLISGGEVKALTLAWRTFDAWAKQDDHLEKYEAGVRAQLIGQRREWYRLHAAWMARTYKRALISNHRLDREARFGEDSDVRFVAAPDQLRGAIKNAFGADAIEARWDRLEGWLGRACRSYLGDQEMLVPPKVKTKNAWAKRKEAKKEKAA